ncbi:MAG TPA: IS110 family transposase [bacterium]|nr:IS110 family transposase [bacterium]
MLYHMGIDVHDEFCSFQHIDSEGSLGLSEHVPTDKHSIVNLLKQLDDPVTITFEAGRNYWWLHELFANQPNVSQVNVVDPRRSRNLAKELSVLSGYGRAKNDDIDAEMLAEQTRRGLAPTIHVPTAEQLEMRTVCRHRFTSVINCTRAKNTVHSILAMHGSKARIKDLLTTDLMMRRKINKSLPYYVLFIIDDLIARINLIDKQIETCTQKLEQMLPESHPQMQILLSHPGIGPVLGRMMHTEILETTYFNEPKYLISYSGLAPIENESAGRKGVVKLNRHCNYYLKYAFVESAHHCKDHVKYRKKYELDVRKHGKIIAKLNLARRIAKTVYWMLTRQQLYRS